VAKEPRYCPLYLQLSADFDRNIPAISLVDEVLERNNQVV
jgi:hypothetical protein